MALREDYVNGEEFGAADVNAITTKVNEHAKTIEDVEPYKVVTTGRLNDWVWKKYNDGTFDAWYFGAASIAITSGTGSLFVSGNNTLSIPADIGADAILFADVNGWTSLYPVWSALRTATVSALTYNLLSTISRAAATYSVSAHIHGTWS